MRSKAKALWFHTTNPAVAEKEDGGLATMMALLKDSEPFPVDLVMGPDGELWFAPPTIYGSTRITYPRLI